MTEVTLIGIIGLVAIAACWSLAVLLYRVSTTGSVARKLTVLLVVEGFVLATAEFPEFAFAVPRSFFESHPMIDFSLGLVHHLCDAAMISLYPPFLAMALKTNLTRPFANKRMRTGLAIGSIVLVLGTVFIPSQIGTTLLYSVVTMLFVYAFVASIHAWRTAKRGVERERAAIFALAFGLRDIGWTMSYGISAWLMWTQAEFSTTPDIILLQKFVYALGTLLAVPLIAYGVLRTQLFDIDLRIRWTIKQSTFAAMVVGIVFAVSEGVEWLVSSEMGDTWGLVAAVVVVFFLKPLQGFAERVVSLLMPRTQNTPEYKNSRKKMVYESALSEAQQDGVISNKERALLVHLRDSLGITESDAEAIERELQGTST